MDFAAARRNMIASQVRTTAVTDPLVIAALGAVPREKFVPAASRSFAYIDEDLAVAPGRHVMEPAVLARLLQLADIQPGEKAMAVACGTGYAAAVLAQMAASVVGIERDPALVAQARQACAEAGSAARIVAGDPTAGCPEEAPFDVIMIDGAVAAIPTPLEAQLADGGRLVTVVRQGTVGRAIVVTRAGDAFSRREGFDAMTPLLPEFAKAPSFVF